MQHNKTKKRGPVAQLDRASGYGPEGWGFDSLRVHHLILCGGVAQLVERRTENPCVAGPIPALATTFFKPVFRDTDFFSFPRTKFVLDSAISALVFGIPSASDWPILLFCSVFSERGCVTFQIRHTPFYTRNPS